MPIKQVSYKFKTIKIHFGCREKHLQMDHDYLVSIGPQSGIYKFVDEGFKNNDFGPKAECVQIKFIIMQTSLRPI